MKILMLSPVFPMPLDLGSKIRIFNLLKGLAHNHEVTFVSLIDSEASREHLAAVRKFCSKLFVIPGVRSRERAAIRSVFSTQPYRVVKFYNKNFQRTVNRILESESYDVIWVNLLNMLSYISLSQKKSAKVVCDQQNADVIVWRKFAREGRWKSRGFAALNLWKLQRFEKKVLSRVDLLVSVSDEDAAFMESRVPDSCSIWSVPNGVDTDYFRRSQDEDAESQHIIVFCGSLDITMNIDATLGFADHAFPKVQADFPDSQFWIVGRNPDPRVRELSLRKGIEVFGDVPDVRPYLSKAKVAVAPFRFGGGTKLKILEAMASGIPVVSTPVGAQGINVTHERDIFIEEDQEQFAETVVDVMQSKDVRHRLSYNARKLAEEKYSWQVILTHLENRLSAWINGGVQ